MFKKQVKIQNTHAVSNKDKKTIKQLLNSYQYDQKSIETFLTDKNYEGGTELMMEKIQGSKAVIYSRNKVPLMFQLDPKYPQHYPTIYTLFQMPDIVTLKVYLKEGVEQYVFNGADLMWPGIKSFSQEEFKQNDVVVVFAHNQANLTESLYVPVAVGKILVGKIPAVMKGKAIQIEHYLYDELWNMGPKKIPEQMQIKKDDNVLNPQEQEENKVQHLNPQDQTDLETSQTLQPTDQEEQKSDSQLIARDQTNQGEEEEEKEMKIPAEEMDPRIVEAFYRLIIDGVQQEELPMEPSDFQKDYLSLYSDINYKLDLRQSSFKRIGKLLEVMHKKGVIDYSEPKAMNHKVITKIHRDCQELKDYMPKYSLRKGKKAAQLQKQDDQPEGREYPRVAIEECYQLGKKLKAVVERVNEFNKSQLYFSIKDCKDLLSIYIIQEKLDVGTQKGKIKLDPLLAQICDKQDQNQVPKDSIFKKYFHLNINAYSLMSHLVACYSVTLCDDSELVKERSRFLKGQVPRIKLVAYRDHNKKKTSIEGLELFQVDYDEFQTYLAHKCSGSVTNHESEVGGVNNKNPKIIVTVQGNHLDVIAEEILPKRYKIPTKYIDRNNLIKPNKKKKN